MRDLYETLGVTKNARRRRHQEGVPQAGPEAAPDKNAGDAKAEEKFKEITAAYDTLSDPEKRKAYDQFGASGGMSAAAASTRPTSATSRASAASTCPTCSSDLFGRVRGGGRVRRRPAGARARHRPADRPSPCRSTTRSPACS